LLVRKLVFRLFLLFKRIKFKMRLTILDITFCAFLLLKFCKGDIDDELPYDFPDPTAETIVCTAMDAVDKDIRINLEGPMMYEDALKLMSWNIKHDFKTAKKNA